MSYNHFKQLSILSMLLGSMGSIAAVIPEPDTPTVLADKSEAKPDKSIQTRAQKLNTLYRKTLEQVDALNDILQYIGPAIDKGTIKFKCPAYKQAAQQWAQAFQKTLSSTRKKYQEQTAVDEELVHEFVRMQQMATQQLATALNTKLTGLRPVSLTPPALRSPVVVTHELLEDKLETNKITLALLKKEANALGLTQLNKVCRKIDAINDRYDISTKLLYTGAGLGLLTGCLYLVPNTWLPAKANLTGPQKYVFGPLWWLKEHAGQRPEYDGKKISNSDTLGVMGNVEALFNHKGTRDILGLIGLFGGWMFGKHIRDIAEGAKNDVKNRWESMKGFTVSDDKFAYKVFDNLTLEDDQVVGLLEAKRALNEVVNYILEPEIYQGSDCTPTRCIMLTGYSGSGKTFLAKALSGSVNEKLALAGKPSKFGFIEAKWDQLVYDNEGLKTVLEKAKKYAPCILFIDEMHNLPLQVNGYSKTLSDFLQAIDGYMGQQKDTKNEILIIGATNRPDLLDPALLRSGRMGDTIIYCDVPTAHERKEYFEIMFKRKSIDTSDIDLDALVRQTAGSSFSDLHAIFKKARFSARALAQGLSQEHLQNKLDTHVHRLRKDMPFTPQEKAMVAAHQAGHALFYMLDDTKPVKQLQAVTLWGVRRKVQEMRIWDTTKHEETQSKIYKRQETAWGKVITYNPAETLHVHTIDDMRKRCALKLAGPLAEELLLGTRSLNYHEQDTAKALAYIKRVLLNGIPESELSKRAANDLKERAEHELARVMQEVRTVLAKHHTTLHAIAQALETRYILTHQELQLLINS